MPSLDWIGKKAVVNHHKQVPFHFGLSTLCNYSMLGLNVMFMNRCMDGFCLWVINDANVVTE